MMDEKDDGRKSLLLDIELYQHASSLPEGKQDSEFEKKTELALKLVDKTVARKYQPLYICTIRSWRISTHV